MITSALLANLLILCVVGGVFVYVASLIPNPFDIICRFIGWIIIIGAFLNFLLALLGHAPLISL